MPSTNKNEKDHDDQSQQAEEQESTEAQDNPSSLAELDLSKLDLRIESVEERISPSETNVFDK